MEFFKQLLVLPVTVDLCLVVGPCLVKGPFVICSLSVNGGCIPPMPTDREILRKLDIRKGADTFHMYSKKFRILHHKNIYQLCLCDLDPWGAFYRSPNSADCQNSGTITSGGASWSNGCCFSEGYWFSNGCLCSAPQHRLNIKIFSIITLWVLASGGDYSC